MKFPNPLYVWDTKNYDFLFLGYLTMLFNPHLYTNMSNYLRMGVFAAVKLVVQCWSSWANGFIYAWQHWTAGVLWNGVWKYVSERNRGLFYKVLVLILLGGTEWNPDRPESVQSFMRPRFELVCCNVVPTTVPDFATVITYFVGHTFWRCRKTWSLTVPAMFTSIRNTSVSAQLALQSLCSCLV